MKACLVVENHVLRDLEKTSGEVARADESLDHLFDQRVRNLPPARLVVHVRIQVLPTIQTVVHEHHP